VSWLTDLFALYGRVLSRAMELTRRHWWLGPLAVAYVGIFVGAGLFASNLGIDLLGSFLVTIVMAGLVSSWFVMIGHVVRSGRVTAADIQGSWFVHLVDVVTFGFLLWALREIGAIAFAELSYVAIVFELALLVFLSAVPEQIYLGSESGAAIFVESYRFVAAHWVEWLPATTALSTLVVAAMQIPFAPLAVVATGIAFAFIFISRGLLFLELTTSSRRAREFQRRFAG
jgi:hypothetical protein